jgi:hypothetical protein
VKLVARDDWVQLSGEDRDVELAETFFTTLQEGRSQGMSIRQADFENLLRAVANGQSDEVKRLFSESSFSFQFKRKSVVPKTLGQKRYVQAIREHEIVFGIGPAGTGKTYLAMAAALDALMSEQVEKLVLTRPAVEAGEALGFLPGDLEEKIQPYLRPLYDSMFEMWAATTPSALSNATRWRSPRWPTCAAHALEELHRARRGAEHHARTDDDVPDAPGRRQSHGHHRRHHPDRPAPPQVFRPQGGPGCARRRNRASRSTSLKARTSSATRSWPASSRPTSATWTPPAPTSAANPSREGNDSNGVWCMVFGIGNHAAEVGLEFLASYRTALSRVT